MPLTPVIITDLSVSYGERPVLDGIDLVAQPGRRIALIGENGAGKSTLLRAIAGRLPRRARSAGTIEAPGDLVMLGQEPPFAAEATIAEVLAATLRPLRHAVSEVERLAGALDDAGAAERLRRSTGACPRPRRLGRGSSRRARRRTAGRRTPRPGTPGRHPVRRPAHTTRAGHHHDHPPDVPAPGRTDQPPRRRGAGGPRPLPRRPPRRGAPRHPRPGLPGRRRDRPRRPRPQRLRHRRRGWPSLRRRLVGVRGSPPARP